MPTLIEIRDDFSNQIFELERGTAESLTSDLRGEIESIHQAAMAGWLRRFGSLDADPTPRQLRSLLDNLRARFGSLTLLDLDSLTDAMASAASLGVDQSLEELREIELTRAERRAMAAAGAGTVATDLDASAINSTAREHRDDVHARMTPRNVASFTALFQILTGLNNMALAMERSVTEMVNGSAANGVRHVAREVGGQLMWVPERDACLHCLAYAGKVIDNDAEFEGGLTYSDKPLATGDLRGPPLHPNCRCRLSVWLGSREGVGPTEAPAALEREAWRTVLRGWSPHASEPARVRAADRLLEKVEGRVPKSVAQVARKAIREGEFTGPGLPPE